MLPASVHYNAIIVFLNAFKGAINLKAHSSLQLRGGGIWERRGEAGACFVTLNVSEKYQSQIHWLLEHLELTQSL